jgi:hypothetical protein
MREEMCRLREELALHRDGGESGGKVLG